MTLRRVVFWLHLLTGIVAGTIVLSMSATGVLLAFEPQLAAFSERDRRTVTPPAPGATPQTLDALLGSVRTALPEAVPSRILVRAEPTASAVVSLGRDEAVFVDPYTGRILGPLLGPARRSTPSWSGTAGSARATSGGRSPAPATWPSSAWRSAGSFSGGRGARAARPCAPWPCSTCGCAGARATSTGTTRSASGVPPC